MDTQTVVIIVAIAVVALVIIGLALAAARRRRQHDRVSEGYGPEYKRTVEEQGGKRAAVKDLVDREETRQGVSLRELNTADRELVGRHMALEQYRFLEDPAQAVYQSGRMLTEVLRVRGYPVEHDREEGLRLFAVDNPEGAQLARRVLAGDYGRDTAELRDVFLGVRRVVQDAGGVDYSVHDLAADRPGTTAGGLT